MAENITKKVKSIQFSMLSPSTVKRISVAKVVTPELYDREGYPVDGGLMDIRMGVIDPGLRCKTCGQRLKECPGHFGYMDLARPVLHIKYLDTIIRYLRSTCLDCGRILVESEKIKKHLDNGTLPEKLAQYSGMYFHMPLAELVKYIYDDSNIFGVYAHFDDIEQRVANLYKFLHLCKEYQDSNESNLYKFLSLLENSIYFSEAKVDEAFFKSDNTKSIEICSIHSTKGLAYPLVLLGNSDKGLYSQITSDSLKHNNFTLNGEKKEIVGFNINGYAPLSMRVLKEIDKLKHLAEKKRLLYVALTRAEHDVVISAKLNAKKDGDISLREDSYLQMMIEALSITKDELFEQDERYCCHVKTKEEDTEVSKQKVSYVNHYLKPLEFEAKEIVSATSGGRTYDETAAKLGTITHKIFELYWDVLEEIALDNIFIKFSIDEEAHKTQIKSSIAKFLKSDIHARLKSGVEHKFELEFNTEDKRGFIDLVYFDESKNGWVIVDFKTGTQSKEKEQGYQEQLDFYESVLVDSGLSVLGKRLLWV